MIAEPTECEEVNEVCMCTQSEVDDEVEETTFEVDGNTFTTDPGGDNETTLEFCVKDDEIIVTPPSNDDGFPSLSFIFARE